MTLEALSEIESLRARIASGNYTIDDCRRAVEIMREGRAIAAEQTITSANAVRLVARTLTFITYPDDP